ncbi:DUF932 domain-containing protein [Burkholderia vietnamiensis]|uniref:DUF932 domain-containing protein n=1 Tax=Burkholderia vietnamiensis TaxID=60552 RepID=UPI003D15F388
MSVPNPGKVVAKRARPETTAGSLDSRGRQQKVLYRSDNKTPLSVDCVRYQVMRPEECLEFDRDLTEISGSQLEMSRCRRQGRICWTLARMRQSGTPQWHGRDHWRSALRLRSASRGDIWCRGPETRSVPNQVLAAAWRGFVAGREI